MAVFGLRALPASSSNRRSTSGLNRTVNGRPFVATYLVSSHSLPGSLLYSESLFPKKRVVFSAARLGQGE
jgi:hypothetical protein